MDGQVQLPGNLPFAAQPPPPAPAPPGGGVQDAGEFAPYYIYSGNTLVELPAINVVRDYDYAYSLEETELRLLMKAGWCAAFEAGAILHTRPLKSRAVVVLSDNGWMRGESTRYTWCVRFDVKANWRVGMPPPRDTAPPAGEDDPEEDRHSGRHILWPIPPERAEATRSRWSDDETLKHSRLVEVYLPSYEPFDPCQIENHQVVRSADPSTLRMLSLVAPAPEPAKHMRKKPMPILTFYDEEPASREAAMWSSAIVSTGLQARARRVMSFTAKTQTPGFAMLGDDVEWLIWSRLVDECIDTVGDEKSASLKMWCTLRKICKASKKCVEDATTRFMCDAYARVAKYTMTRGVEDAIEASRLLVPRGISFIAVSGEMAFANYMGTNLSNSIYPYMRIRSEMTPDCAPPPPPKPPRAPRAAANIAAMAPRRNIVIKPCGPAAAIALPLPKPERSSLRLGLKRSSVEDYHFPTDVGPCFTGVTLKMQVAAEPEPMVVEAKLEACSWVQCGVCDKWRRLAFGGGLGDSLSVHDLPKFWACDMHPSGITCDDPEDATEEGEVTTAAFGDTPAKKSKISQPGTSRTHALVRRTRSAGKSYVG